MDESKADRLTSIKNRPNFIRKGGVMNYLTKGLFLPKYGWQRVILVELEGKIVVLLNNILNFAFTVFVC